MCLRGGGDLPEFNALMEIPNSDGVLLDFGASRCQPPPPPAIQSVLSPAMNHLQPNPTRTAASRRATQRAHNLPNERRERARRRPRTARARARLQKAPAAELWGNLMPERGPVSLEALKVLRDLLQARYFAAAESHVQRRIAG